MTRRRSRIRGASGAAPALVALLVSGGALAQTVSDFEVQREVRHLVIEGNSAYSDGKLRPLLRTRGESTLRFWRSSPYRSDFVRVDRITLQSFYRRHGYLEASVGSARVVPVAGSPSKVDVYFDITEGPLYRIEAVAFSGAGPIAEAELAKLLSQKPGDPLDLPKVEVDRQALENRYGDLGYVTSQVRDSLEVRGTLVRVVYRIHAGDQALVGGVQVEGNRLTRTKMVTRGILLRPGDVVSRSKLLGSQQLIYDTGLYSDVVFERGPIDSATHRTDLTVSVIERKMAWVDAGLGYGTVDNFRVTGEWGHRNIAREGIRFVATGKLGIRFTTKPLQAHLGDRRLDAGVSHPWIFGLRTQGRLGGYYEDVRVIREETDFPFTAYGTTFTLRRDLARYTYGSVGLEYRHVDSSSVDTIPGKSTYATRRVVLSGERDTRRDIFDPKLGSIVFGSAEFAGGVLEGSSNFLKLNLSGSVYRPSRRRSTVALRLRGGYVDPFGAAPNDPRTGLDLIPKDDRFRTGGATSVRGFFENEIGVRNGDTRGGSLLLGANAEIRFPLAWVVSGAVFVDAGNVWERAEDVTLKRVFTIAGGDAGYADMRYTFGTGVRLGTPVGPVRFDYGWKLRGSKATEPDVSSRRGTFHFSLGQAF